MKIILMLLFFVSCSRWSEDTVMSHFQLQQTLDMADAMCDGRDGAQLVELTYRDKGHRIGQLVCKNKLIIKFRNDGGVSYKTCVVESCMK